MDIRTFAKVAFIITVRYVFISRRGSEGCSLACLFACLFACLLACLFVCLLACLFVCLFVGILDALYLLFLL